jgi:hypothetical protein
MDLAAQVLIHSEEVSGRFPPSTPTKISNRRTLSEIIDSNYYANS